MNRVNLGLNQRYTLSNLTMNAPDSRMADMAEQLQQASAFLKLLANPNRLAILCALHEGQYNVGELANRVGLPQAALSNQLMLLREAGVIDCEVKHRERLYYIKDARVGETIQLLHGFFCAKQQ